MAKLLLLFFFTLCRFHLFSQTTIIHYLSGTDKEHRVQWDFKCNRGMNNGKWMKIPVPSCWEQEGFGTFNYGQDSSNPDEQGFYRYQFKTEPEWKNKKIFIVFEGSMTDTEVKINGKSAGPVHQGGFYQFKYEITDLVQNGTDHLLEVTVSKRSSNHSVNRAERQADFWMFGGIYRPVYLEIVPQSFIAHTAIDAKSNGDFGIQVFTKNAGKDHFIEVQLQELNGKNVGKLIRFPSADSAFINSRFNAIKKWNPEHPNLYNAVIYLKQGNRITHQVKKRFGFRTVEFRKREGFYVNDVRVIFKGVCRHSQWPESGRTLSREIHLLDIGLMKDMNMNAVRMSHYPPDKEFLDLCDSLGLFVIDELTGWQKAYDTVVGRKLVKEMVMRDVNHPSIIMWANGNEGGWNRAIDGDFHWYDPQKRFVMHPWEKFNGTETKHYPTFNYVSNAVLYGEEVFYPTEFMHGLFDGGHGAGLDDFWNEMKKHRAFAGGFLWALHDEGVVRTDKEGMIDVSGNYAPDGIVGPHREKEASYYTIKEIWSPIGIERKSIPENFDGRIEIENRYLYTNLNQCSFEWKLISLAEPGEKPVREKLLKKGTVRTSSLTPGERGWLIIPKISDENADALYLLAKDAKGNIINTWSWSLTQPEHIVKRSIEIPKVSEVVVREANGFLDLNCDGINYRFDKSTGYLQHIVNGKNNISLSGGPSLAGVKLVLKEFKHYNENGLYIIEPVYPDNQFFVKWKFQSGKLPKLEYSFNQRTPADFIGITFNYPEQYIEGMKWMGRGPYRVWKNRLKGQQFGVWEKSYNNTVTGESWNYPEFKGWHSEMHWVRLMNKESAFTVYTDQSNIFLQMLQPQRPKAARNENTGPPFPEGNFGFMHAISAIGTKFQGAELLGPQSQKNMQMNYELIKGSLYFDFR